MKKAIAAVVKGENLSREEAARVMNLILSGEATPAQEAAFFTALRIKSETLDEIIGCAQVLSEKAEHIKPKIGNYIDFVGTGGNAQQNATITMDILSGVKGARRDIVLFNAGAAIYIGESAKDIAEGIQKTEEAIDSGKAMAKLKELAEYSQKQ